jgi:hypothetical protein
MISEDQAYSMIFQAMALRENVLHAANLTEIDERRAFEIIAAYESRFAELSVALNRGDLTSSQFGQKRDQLTRVTRTKLQATLTRGGWLRFDKFVRTQVAHIRASGIQPHEA